MKNIRVFPLLFCIFMGFLNLLRGQVPKTHFNNDSLNETYYSALQQEFGNHKKIPPVFEKPILIALSYYPELKNTAIRFRLRKRLSILQTRSSWSGLFKTPLKRDFVITISRQPKSSLSPLLFKNVPFEAQVGAAGHELAHVADFSEYSSIQILMHGIRNISPKYLDRFEFKTDSICIAHGLGYQLLSWSRNVRKMMNTINWRGPDYVHQPQNTERYMNPSTILQRIESNPLYLITGH